MLDGLIARNGFFSIAIFLDEPICFSDSSCVEVILNGLLAKQNNFIWNQKKLKTFLPVLLDNLRASIELFSIANILDESIRFGEIYCCAEFSIANILGESIRFGELSGVELNLNGLESICFAELFCVELILNGLESICFGELSCVDLNLNGLAKKSYHCNKYQKLQITFRKV